LVNAAGLLQARAATPGADRAGRAVAICAMSLARAQLTDGQPFPLPWQS